MTIAANTTITQALNHYVLDTAKTLLSQGPTGYGLSPISDYIGTGTLIKAVNWANLYNDVNKAYVHQNGVSLVYPSGEFPVQGARLSRGFVDALITAADSITSPSNRYTVHSSQLKTYTTGSVGRNSTFTEALVNTVDMVWPDELAADWYFNLGGSVRTDLSATVPTPGVDTEHDLVVNLVNGFRNTVQVPFDRDIWLATKVAPGRSLVSSHTTSTSVGTFTAYFTVSNTYQILDSAYANTSTIRVTTEIIPTTIESLIPQFTLTAAVTVTNLASTGSIVAIDPEVTQTKDFDDNVASTNVRRTRTLAVSTASLYYSLVGGSTSTVQSFTIYNQNVDATSSVATITEILIGSNVVTPYPFYEDPLPITIGVGSSAVVLLHWDKPTVALKDLGEFSNPIVIKSNNTRGDVVIPTRVKVLEPLGVWAFSTSSVTTNLTTYKKLTESIRIVTQYSELRNIDVNAISLTGSSNFTLVKKPSVADPTIIITYDPIETANGAYTASLTVTAEVVDITGDYLTSQHTFSFTVNQALADANLGNWISPLGPINGVIGASYDIIGGQRWLTLGVGTGADGSPTIDQGGGNYARAEYLGINNHSLTPTTYAFKQYTSSKAEWAQFGQFIKDYGIYSTQPYIKHTDPKCQFDIDIDTPGLYTVKYSVYETGYVELDDVRISLTTPSVSNYQSAASRTLNLTAGTHTLRFVGNLGMALTITDATGKVIWSTLNITQEGPAYRYWYEVYRFPIYMDGKQVTLKSKDYRVKDTALARTTATKKYYPYGDFYGRSKTDYGNIFEVKSFGTGKVKISIEPIIQQGNVEDTLTLGTLSFAFYYLQKSIPRYTHKTGGRFDGNSVFTDRFSGFDKYGTVLTDQVVIPRQFNYDNKNNILDMVVTFYLSNLLVDLVVIETGLFQAWVFTGSVYEYSSVSVGAWLLEKAGVDLTSNTVGGWIVQSFDQYFGTSLASLPSDALGYLSGLQNSAIALGESISAGTTQVLSGVKAVYAPLTELGQDATILFNDLYAGEATAEATAAGFSSELTPVLLESLGSTGAAFAIGATGVALTVVGISKIREGIQNGDIGAVAIGAAASYGGWALAGDLILGAAAGGCFTGNTVVELGDGTTKPIKDIEVGTAVKNANGTGINLVTYVEHASGATFPTLYSPDFNIEPFATSNHPLKVDGEWAAPDHQYYLWLNTKQLAEYRSSTNKDTTVYNLWVTGDHTYRANGFGTTSIIGDGGAMLNCLKHQILTDSDIEKIIIDMVSSTPINTYGSYLINRFLGRFDTKLITVPLVYFACAEKGTIRRSIFWAASELVGRTAKLIKRK